MASVVAGDEVSRINLFLHAENTRIFGSAQPQHLPVTVVTGFLGAGKTTLLKYMLENKQNLRIAAAVNDFGALNIDGQLVKNSTSKTTQRTIELSNGCACCSIINDLTEAVWTLLQEIDRTAAYDYLVIETSGVTDPRKIVSTLDATFGKMYRARLDSVVCVVDTDAWSPERTVAAAAQVRSADVVLMNKVDLVSEARKALVRAKIKSFSPHAKVVETVNSRIPLHKILDIVDSTLSAASTGDGQTNVTHEKTDAPYYVSATGGALRRLKGKMLENPSGVSTPQTNHLQEDKFTSFSLTLGEKPIRLSNWINFVRNLLPEHILVRAKGILWVTENDNPCDGKGVLERWRCVFHMSGRSPGRWSWELDGEWQGPPQSKLVFIGPRLKEVELRRMLLDEGQEVAELSQVLTDREVAVRQWGDDNRFVKVFGDYTTGRSGCCWVRLNGASYGFKDDDEVHQELRVKMDDVNKAFVDSINSSLDEPKVFVAYATIPNVGICVCLPGAYELKESTHTKDMESKWWWPVFTREADNALKVAFANVKVCKCD
jgi:G3E family GTPase|eukprot:g5549.t1